jgi:PAS domain S-box-containing protein
VGNLKHQAIDNKKSKNQGKEAVSQRKQVTLEGRESEEIYSTIVEKGNDGVVIIQDGILKFINTMMTRMTGYTKEEGIGKPFIDFISPPSKLLVYERYEKRLAGENVPNRYELEIISKNGTNIPVEINASIIDYEGKPADMAIIRDITERNRSEEALAKSADFSNRLISFMQDGFSVLDTKGVHLDVNPALCKMTGFSREELIGAGTPHPYWPPEEYEHIQAAFQMTLKSETNNFELKFMRKNGERFPVIVSPSTVKDRKGDIISYTATVKDITERKRTEKALEAALIKSEDEKNRTDAIISALGDGIIIQDTDYKIIYQNQIQKEIYGDHLGEFCYKVYENRDIICEDCPVEITFIDGKIHKSERAIPTDNGIKYFELTSSALREPSGRITAGVKVVRDITELKRMEGALRERERFLNGIFESIQDGISVLDKDMTIIRINHTVENWYPHMMPLAGKKCYEAYHGRKERCELCPSWTSIKTRKTAHEIVPRHGQDGKAVGWMEIYSYPMLDAKTGELTGVIEYVRDITERKLAEEKLKLLSEAMETALDGIQIVSLEGRIIYSNRAVEEIYGFSRNELTGKQVTVMKDDPDITEKLIIPSLKETGRWMGELLVKHKDGSVFPIWLSTSLVLNDKGEPIATVGIIKDMTERKETERKLKEAHSFLQSVINGVAEPIMVIDINYRVKLMNQAAGGGLSELPDNLCCYQISHHSDKPCINSEHPCPLEEVRRTGRPITVVHEHFKANGKKRFYEILASPFYDSDGAFAGIVESSRDITERKRAEEALRESEEKFRNIVEQSGDGIVLTDEEGTIIEWNGAEEKIIGLNRADVIGCLIWDVQFQSAVPEKKTGEVYEKLKASLQKLLTTGKSPMLNRLWENDIIRPDGSRRCVQVQVFLIKTERGFKAGSITRDITERKKAEEAIRKYASDLEESNKMKELFTDIMHHDLINPLNTVSGFIEILREEEDEPRKRIYLETIERNLAKGVELIESTTTLSRLESLQSIEFESIDIADVIRSNIENIRQEAEKAGIQIENRITQCMPVRANRIIEEVFSNLFSNAIKYASSGKKIIVDSKETDGFWRVNVVDFGAGIKDSEKTLIFERFRRLEKKGVKGSGLGLAIAKKIMELHNGRIWVEDNPEGGAIFVVEIRKNSSG